MSLITQPVLVADNATDRSSNLSIDNVVQYHECSNSLQYEPLFITSEYIKNNCEQILPTGKLTKLRIDNLKSLLGYKDTDDVEEHIKLDINR